MTTEIEAYLISLLKYLKRKKERPYCYSEECKRHYAKFPINGKFSQAMEDATTLLWRDLGVL